MELNGFCKDGFEPVRDAFVANFERGVEVGASVAVTHDGESVVDLWAGDADPHGTPWVEDTIVCVFSTTKTMVAMCRSARTNAPSSGGGWGGSLAIIDLDARVSIAYVMNRMAADPGDRRGGRLAAAVYKSLA